VSITPAPTLNPMLAESANHIWHFWLAVPLAAVTILAVVGVMVGYLVRVTRTRYPQK
jgi:hypothetical protein